MIAKAGGAEEFSTILDRSIDHLFKAISSFVSQQFIKNRLSDARGLLIALQKDLKYYLIAPQARLDTLGNITTSAADLVGKTLYVEEGTPRFWSYPLFVTSSLLELTVTQERIHAKGPGERDILRTQLAELWHYLDKFDTEFLNYSDALFKGPYPYLKDNDPFAYTKRQYIYAGKLIGPVDYHKINEVMTEDRRAKKSFILTEFINIARCALRQWDSIFGNEVHDRHPVFLKDEGTKYFGSAGGDALPTLSPNNVYDPKNSDELVFPEKSASVGGILQYGDRIRLRTRRSTFVQIELGADGAERLTMADRFAQGSEKNGTEWVIENGDRRGHIRYGDRIYLRSAYYDYHLNSHSSGNIVIDKLTGGTWTIL